MTPTPEPVSAPEPVSELDAGFAALLPSAVRTAELQAAELQAAELRAAGEGTGAESSAPPLHPAEERLMRDAVPRRRAEFRQGRALAREALRQLGRPADAILRGPRNEPLWPRGVVGSITHCPGLVAAAVARTDDVIAVGIDAEVHEPLPEGVLELILGPEESAEQIDRLGRRLGGVHAGRLLFSAKESLYKAWHPQTGLWLDFHEAAVDVHPDGALRARVLRTSGPHPQGVPRVMEGRWSVSDGFVRTAVVVAR